jgi:D-alanyl-D-alanine carboxypeptidase (penicillin-binding protein 5/6)
VSVAEQLQASPRRVYSSAGRRRRARGRVLGRAVAIGAILLLVVLFWTRARGGGAPTAVRLDPVAHGSAGALALDWPGEGAAAVAVDGIGSLGTSGGRSPVPIASVAKVMTAYLTLREDPLGPGEEGFTMEVSGADVEDLLERIGLNQSVVEVEAGEVLSERQALEALLLPSANNVAAMLAEHEAGSVEAFVAEMNEAAAELGMARTHYTDPSGWEDSTVSTATDQLKVGRAAMEDPVFAEIVAMPATVLPVAGEVTNFNGLVGQEGFVGIKTGSDQAAGGCLLFARRIEIHGRPRMMFGAVLGQRDGDLVEAALGSARSLSDSALAALDMKAARAARRADASG